MPCLYIPLKACNYGEKYLAAKTCLKFCKRAKTEKHVESVSRNRVKKEMINRR
jgi:hypothetical protein